MKYDLRPDPDALLAELQKEHARQQRGKLKIFLGMAAGVGKTYAMLEAAHALVKTGAQLVVGYVETHGRAETEALLPGLEIIPRARLEYRGHILEEMDLDAILARHPQLVLVDELAHTNAPGARHLKRYQDVVELLDAGISVLSTLNVQHIASRADTVAQITGITVFEAVPDTVVDLADEIELVDLTPEELRQRLTEGKVYVPGSAELAAKNFFRVGNLTALREMALRLTAERVDHQLQDYMSLKRIAGPWKSGERLMVAVSESPLTERLVRWTRRIAYNLQASWLAVNVETSRSLSEDAKALLARNLTLARELGAEVVTTSDEDVVRGLLRVAHERNVTQVVVGKPVRGLVDDLRRGRSMVDRLIRASGDLDIYVVTGQKSELRHGSRPGDAYVRLRRSAQAMPAQVSDIKEYLLAAIVVASVIAINLVAQNWISYQAVGLVLLFTVSFLAYFMGRGPVLLAAALSAVLWDLLFLPPVFTLSIGGIENSLMFGLYFAIALATGSLTSRLRAQERTVREREKRTAALYALARAIASAPTMDGVLGVAAKQIDQVFDAAVAFYLREGEDHLNSRTHEMSNLTVDEKERSVATWAFTNRRPAGQFTDTLPLAEARWIPLITPSGVFGVMGVRVRERLSLDQESLLETFASQVALAVEREFLDEAAEHAAVVAKSEQMYRTLLDSVSHELRTPMTTIRGAAETLGDPKVDSQIEVREKLLMEIRTAADRLDRLVENLLDMTRLESGLLKPKLDWCDVADLVGATLERLKPYLVSHEVIVDVQSDLPLVRLDFALMEQALANLIHNSATHTPPGTRVRVSAKVQGTELVITVADRGPGLPVEVLPKIFDKFYRAPNADRVGVGLGLSIARGLVEAHGGRITAENRTRGGISFIIRLPVGERPPATAQSARQAG
ncbi:MAG: sensor histidine kinase KdpD [Chloroflexi bacterium]|nr:sensor histidine kinase KdpD [Chloroflexota bacterium]